MPTLLRHILAGIGFVLLQWLVLGRMTIFGVYPDVVLLFVAWLGIRHGRRAGAVGGFLTGFLLDLIYDTWGLNMLAKSLIGFILGLFPAGERESLLILPRQAFLGGFVVALVHNGVIVTLLALQAGERSTFLLTGLWLGAALYTAVIGTLATIASGR